MSHVQIRASRDKVSVVVDGKDITDAIAAFPMPVVEVGPVGQESRVRLTLFADVLDLEVEADIEDGVSE